MMRSSFVSMIALLLTTACAITQAAAQNMALQTREFGLMVVPRHSSLEPSAQLTAEAWIWCQRAEPSNGRAHRILYKNDSSHGGYSLIFKGIVNPRDRVSARVCYFSSCLAAIDQQSYLGLLRSWHHIAVTAHAGQTIRLYVDGQRVDSVAAPPVLTHGGSLVIGGHYDSTVFEEEFDGLIDEVRIWNVERTESEIQAGMYQSFDQAPGLVSVWHMDGDPHDSVSGNHGVLLGIASFQPSDCPIVQQFELNPATASWRGGESLELTGQFPNPVTQLEVYFGTTRSPRAVVLGQDRLEAEVPPGIPGTGVLVTVRINGQEFEAKELLHYLPLLAGPDRIQPGQSFELELQMTPPATFILFAGLPPAVGFPLPPFGGELRITPPVVELIRWTLPFPRFQAHLPLPDDPALAGQTLLFQAFVLRSLPAGDGAFTNALGALIQ